MRILITGVTSGLGRLAAAHLLASGHRVTGVALRAHRDLDRRVTVTYRPLDPDRLAALTDDADVVIHLAPVEPDAPESVELTGLLQLADAAARSGTRLIVPIHAGGDPELYRQAQELAVSSWGPTLMLRLAPLIGRLDDIAVRRTLATLVSDRHHTTVPVRLLHVDDLCRFLSLAVDSDRTGELDVAGVESITYVAARRLLAGLPVRRGTPLWEVPDPIFRLIPLQRDWQFECGWTAADAVADVALGPAGRPLGDDGCRVFVAAPTTGSPAAVEGTAGEFDYPIDPRYPVFSAAGVPDALPGPLTPITLDVQVGAMRAAQRATAGLLGMPADLGAEWGARATAVFGHRVYTGVSVHDAYEPRAATAQRVLRATRGYSDRCQTHAAAVAEAALDAETLGTLSDARIDTRMMLLCNQIQDGWELSSLGVSIEGAFNRLARRPAALTPPPATMTSTGHVAAHTAVLAGLLRRGAAGPEFAAAFDAAVRDVGHRGPGEAELANPVIADDPGLLLAAAELAATEEAVPAVEPERPPSDPIGRRIVRTRSARETAWDSTVRATHQLRILLRENGSRMAAADVIDNADDVCYLTRFELLSPPPDLRGLVDRRRAEMARLQALSLPEVIDAQWTPAEHLAAEVGATLAASDLADAAS